MKKGRGEIKQGKLFLHNMQIWKKKEMVKVPSIFELPDHETNTYQDT